MSSPRPRKRRRLLLCLLILLTGPLVLEGAVRLRAWIKFGYYDDIYDLFEEHPAGMLVGRPGLAVTFANECRIENDSRGFRSPELADPKPAGLVRLAFLGGSTTFCAEAVSNERTWPHLVRDGLAQRLPDVDFDYVNAAVTGYSVADSTLAVRHRLREVDPDVIVICHAAKDLADDTRAMAVEQGLLKLSEPGWLAYNSKLWMLLRKNWIYRTSRAAGHTAERKLDYDPDALAQGFRGRLTTLVREAAEVADVVVLSTFPIKTRADQKEAVQYRNLTQAFTFTPYLTPAGVLAGYEAYNRVVAEVARGTGAVLVAGHADIPGTGDYFSDSVHFTERGFEANAARVVDGLLGAESFLALVGPAPEEMQR